MMIRRATTGVLDVRARGIEFVNHVRRTMGLARSRAESETAMDPSNTPGQTPTQSEVDPGFRTRG